MCQAFELEFDVYLVICEPQEAGRDLKADTNRRFKSG